MNDDLNVILGFDLLLRLVSPCDNCHLLSLTFVTVGHVRETVA
jgi:hypothetical protein